jgi:tight adherence protein B
MDNLSLIYIFVFCAVVLAVQGGYWLIAERRRTQGALNRRLELAKHNVNSNEVFEALMRERGLRGLDNRHFAHINEQIIQTGLRLDERRVVGFAFSLSVVYFILFGFAVSFGLVAFVLAVICSALSLLLTLTVIRRKRIAKFSAQLPDAIDVIVRGVKSGYPFTVALSLVAKELPDPIGTEFGLTSDEINFGANLSAALDNLYRRVGHDDLLYLTMAVKIQSETGGNLAEILARLARLIRERAMLRIKVRSLTAEGRLSAYFLTAFPFVIFILLNLIAPNYYSGVIGSPYLIPALLVGLIMIALGNGIIYRMVNFKV